MKTGLAIVIAATFASALLPAAPARADSVPPAPISCAQKYLVILSAMPLELDPLLADATITASFAIGNRSFYVGTLDGNSVVMGLTGIGTLNATNVTSSLLTALQCSGSLVSGIVFSGTSGGDYIGDVFVPQDWTLYDPIAPSTTTYNTDPTMHGVAASAAVNAQLEQTTPLGDPACVCSASAPNTPITVLHKPVVDTVGHGLSNDGFGNRAIPCTPGGSDILGCTPCREQNTQVVDQTTAFPLAAAPFVNPDFFFNYESRSASPPGNWVEDDMETAAVAKVASTFFANAVIPFIGFRSASDGTGTNPPDGGDPLGLPGFPAQFAVYRQLAADNAAAATMAFLSAWHNAGH